MKKHAFSLLIITVATSAMLYTGCNNAGEGRNEGDTTMTDTARRDDATTGDATNREGTAAGQTTLDDDSRQFLTEAASGGIMEVELGRMAQEQATDQRVKNFGSMMVKDHTAANNELKSLAQRKNFMVPDSMNAKEQRHRTDLSKKRGRDFDKTYMKMMVDDHEDDIDEFEKAANRGTDADIKSFASKTLPTLRKHLDSAKAIVQTQDK